MAYIILFDIDGTLVLTGGAGRRALQGAFHDVFGIDGAFDGIPVAGRIDPVIIEDALRRAEVSADSRTLNRLRDRYVERLAREIQVPHPKKTVMPGIRRLLDALEQREDVYLGLLTGNFQPSARLKLEYFDLWRYFRSGAFGDDAPDREALVPIAVSRAETAGATVRSAGPEGNHPWNEAGPVPREQVLVVGDTPLDIRAAQAFGARSVAVATGSTDSAALGNAGVDVVFEDLSETEKFLRLLV